MVKQTAGRDALGNFAPSSQNSTMMCSSAKYGAARQNFHFVIAAW